MVGLISGKFYWDSYTKRFSIKL